MYLRLNYDRTNSDSTSMFLNFYTKTLLLFLYFMVQPIPVHVTHIYDFDYWLHIVEPYGSVCIRFNKCCIQNMRKKTSSKVEEGGHNWAKRSIDWFKLQVGYCYELKMLLLCWGTISHSYSL